MLSRASQIFVWYICEKLRIEETFRDNLLHGCWFFLLPWYFLFHVNNIFAVQSGSWEVSVTNSCSYKHPFFEKVRFCWQLGSQYFAGSLPCCEGWNRFHLILPFSTFKKLLWIFAIPSRLFSAHLRNTGQPPAFRHVHLRDQYLTDQQMVLKYKLLSPSSWCTALICFQVITDTSTILNVFLAKYG